ncbi:sigma-70 family RNA polymerase sigma factor [Actinoplanes sp. N902-109]|uniref:sigma-70 family RNA polymerase sigma factor n=1 Tax=Actinoplanes sp. (strain N902-109) TaxID=649831 RepID=UPI000329472F|nr:sigma-70 family RNA polymerase sigma factor [Actinoplanes sp. N902-109]AGL19113.1 putative RNA polymerase ECF-subfamily sigma factor [Actinoplanes sp. N902-109]
MRATRTDDSALVTAAQAGDRQALDQLLRAGLPLVYTVVRRGMGAHPDVDDVVQETMLRVIRQLPSLRSPAQFRSWLAAIAVRQVGTQLRRSGAGAARTARLDEAESVVDDNSPSEEATALGVDFSRQRRQVERAGHWLDADNRALLPLWWLAMAGELSRGGVAAAIGVSPAHAGVRMQRLRTQLEASRQVVAALERRPRCPDLAAVVATWDGTARPLWRKRIARHVHSCAYCSAASSGLVAAERLLPALALLPVPAELAGTVAGGAVAAPAAVAVASGLGLKAGIGAALAHPVVVTLTVGALVAGGAAATTRWPSPDRPAAPPAAAAPIPATSVPAPTASAPPVRARPPAPAPASPRSSPTVTRSPSGAAPTLGDGPVSLEAQNAPGRFVAVSADLGVLLPDTRDNRGKATFRVVPGLNDPRCHSFRTVDGRYLRHSSWRLRASPDDGTALFRGDATFCSHPAVGLGSVTLESSNYPGWFLRHRGDQLWVDQSDGSTAFVSDGSFVIRRAQPS